MATMRASVGEQCGTQGSNTALKAAIYESIEQLSHWLEENDYRGYDTFDGLNIPICAFNMPTRVVFDEFHLCSLSPPTINLSAPRRLLDCR